MLMNFEKCIQNLKNGKKVLKKLDPNNIYQSELSNRLGLKMVNNYLIIGADSELAKAFIQLNPNKESKFFKISRNRIESDLEIGDYFDDIDKVIDYVKKLPTCYVIFFNGFLAENRPTQFPSTEEIRANL